jgi:hypothetical protein
MRWQERDSQLLSMKITLVQSIWSKNKQISARMKHMDIHHHYHQDLHESGRLEVRFKRFRRQLGRHHDQEHSLSYSCPGACGNDPFRDVDLLEGGCWEWSFCLIMRHVRYQWSQSLLVPMWVHIGLWCWEPLVGSEGPTMSHNQMYQLERSDWSHCRITMGVSEW